MQQSWEVGQVMKGQRWERTGGWQDSLAGALKLAHHEVGEEGRWDGRGQGVTTNTLANHAKIIHDPFRIWAVKQDRLTYYVLSSQSTP